MLLCFIITVYTFFSKEWKWNVTTCPVGEVNTHFQHTCMFKQLVNWILHPMTPLNTFQHFRNKHVCKLHQSTVVTLRWSGFGSAQKGFKHWILNRFLLVNSEMWIWTAIKLPHDLGVCQKTVSYLAGDFYGGDERKFWIRMAIKSPTTPLMVKITYVPTRRRRWKGRVRWYSLMLSGLDPSRPGRVCSSLSGLQSLCVLSPLRVCVLGVLKLVWWTGVIFLASSIVLTIGIFFVTGSEYFCTQHVIS